MTDLSSEWLVCPGDVLGTTADYVSGEGTYVDGEQIRSLLLGICSKEKGNDAPLIQNQQYLQEEQLYEKQEQQEVIQVRRKGNPPVVPKQGDIITGRVLKVTPRLAQVQILCIEEVPIKRLFEGIIRVQDVRLTEIDKVQMYECFRSKDIVRARVLSLGDARSYFLTTAEDALGVVQAIGANEEILMPKNNQEMQSPETQEIVKRKVAITQ
eukprot:TRINITY_DN14320_c0_g2_i13.p1 TRINITY_DN14320_c0_g2~~TRINITY_DN14320_c0_g2_i13.p1  ORF type:complete len:211 (-),score=28.17 TRINITY_DN14320_c0_g2_i13:235-867(-)